MNSNLFDQAEANYRQSNFQDALLGFTDCLQDESSPLALGDAGLLYHRIGNCLIKLKNPSEAIQAYAQALGDEAYGDLGAVHCNTGMAYASLHDYDNAIAHFKAAIADDGYESVYKAYMGLGGALMKLGKSAEAGVAFREAALDELNPEPTKALLNLGLCFMMLDRPADAVVSYECALQFNAAPALKNKLNANLGQAYVACSQMEQAVSAFEAAIADKTYFLSDSASVDYQRAVAALAQGTSEMTQVLDLADISGLDIGADGEPIYDDATDYSDPFYYDEDYDESLNYPGYVDAYAKGDEDRFFNASEEELEKFSRGMAKRDRKRRNVGLKAFVAVIIVVLLAFAAMVFAYSCGYGFPTQEMVAQKLFADPDNAKDSLFAEVDADSIAAMVNLLSPDDDIEINGVNRSMSSSIVYVTAHTEQGGEIVYKLSMVRDMLGWKVSNVELYNASLN